jgi:RNA polymerase sigma factor (sigma-70 family)
MSACTRTPDEQLDDLMRAARNGDDAAWAALIARFDRSLRSIARGYRLGAADIDDVVQLTWMRLYQNIDRLREPKAVAGWLATCTRREAMHVLQKHVREHLSDDPELGDVPVGERPDAVAIAAERRAVLARAIAELPGRQREILTLLAALPDANYRHISATLQMPLGSIGPIRARGLARLERHAELRSHHLAGA